MKNLILSILTLMLLCPLAQAQYFMKNPSDEPQNLFEISAKITGFGAPELKYTYLNDKSQVMAGIRGGVIFNGHVMLGAGVYGYITPIDIPNINSDGDGHLNAGYMGIFTGVNIAPRKLIHISMPLFLGAGSAQLYQYKDVPIDGHSKGKEILVEKSGFLVVEPSVIVEINLTKHIKMGLGAGYRHVGNLDLKSNFGSSDLSGFTGNFCLSLGRFL